MKITEEFTLCRSEWERLIDEWIFDKTHRKIIKHRLLDGLSYERLAEKFDLSCNTVRRIIKQCENELKMHIK